jgi:Na+/phosphate symporter
METATKWMVGFGIVIGVYFVMLLIKGLSIMLFNKIKEKFGGKKDEK